MEGSKSSQSVYCLKYYTGWVCKYRLRILNPEARVYLRKLFSKLLRSIPVVEIKTIGIEKDHLHMVMAITPKYSFPNVKGRLKYQSASQFRKKFSWLKTLIGKKTLSGYHDTSSVAQVATNKQ